MSTTIIFNIYLILILVGVMFLVIKVHDLKLLLKTYFEITSMLNQCVKEIEERLREDDKELLNRCDLIEADIQKIINIINRKEL